MNRSLSCAVISTGFAAVIGGFGCLASPECTLGFAKCEGNTAMHCFAATTQWGEEVPMWFREDCGAKTCRSGPTQTVCSIGPDPDPVCFGDSSPTAHCAGGTLIGCDSGYRVEVLEECGGELCKELGLPPRGACVTSPDPLLACAGTQNVPSEKSVCAGDHELTCRGGYALRDRDCGSGLCYTPEPRGSTVAFPPATCVRSRDPDPRCVDATLKLYSFPATDPRSSIGCDANQLFSCTDGMLTNIEDCAPKTCDRPPGFADPACEPRVANPSSPFARP